MSGATIHNGGIVIPAPGVETESASPELLKRLERPGNQWGGLEDIDPDQLAATMAFVVAEAFDESPRPLPIQVVNRLLQLKTAKGHKLLWTRFDMMQLFGLYAKRQGAGR